MKSFQVAEFNAPLKEVDQETPQPTGTQVLIKVKAAGVCHSDLHIWEGGYDLGHDRKLSLRDRGVTLPLTLGHETVGEVVALGPDAEGVEIGQTYLVFPWIGCGDCPVCAEGYENYCLKASNIGVHRDGGYADYVRVPKARYLLPIGDLDPAEIAPYACSGVTTYSAIHKLGTRIAHQPVVLIGAGGLGLMAIKILRALGGSAVVVDIDAGKREAAVAAGALAAIDGTAADAAAQVAAAVGSAPLSVIDLVGSPQTAQFGFDVLTKGGTLVMVGLFGNLAPWSLAMIPLKGISIIGNLVGTLDECRELIDLVRAGRIEPIPVTRIPLDRANETLMDLRDGKVAGRAVLCP